ncbi:MAG: hypothetical protein OEM02_15105 [Desulfobulbaceae bacterium]|nr:hypothetical protein [Desulfobulbaceae bacterium]
MKRFPNHKKRFLIISLLSNLGILGVFKYFNFFTENISIVLDQLGLHLSPPILQVVLPVGISFYTFQTLSYSIDIYRGKLEARTNFIDLAAFVAFFPQLVAGPIERATNFLPQLEKERTWCWVTFDKAWPLILKGYFKKLVIADTIATFVNQIYMINHPGSLLLFIGTTAFAIQIFTDFSGYTDIARGTARLFGFELMRNFNNPYLAISPSDFWRRWHISLSSWIRDYLFIPLGGSRHHNRINTFIVIMITMTLCGLWHGAAWNFVLWGVFHGLLLVIYHMLGLGGNWQPKGWLQTGSAWLTMSCWTLLGWFIFRSPSLEWMVNALNISSSLTTHMEAMVAATKVMLYIIILCMPLGLVSLVSGEGKFQRIARIPISLLLLLFIVIFHKETGMDFIYFQF